MEIRIETRTAAGVLAAIQKALNENRRRQVFRAVGNAGAGVLSVSPAAEDTETWGGSPGTDIRASSGTPGTMFRDTPTTWPTGWRPSSRRKKGRGSKKVTIDSKKSYFFLA